MKIALLGYGKMGKEVEKISIAKHSQIILKVNSENSSIITPEQLKKADIAIEFSRPEVAFQNVIKCFEAGIPVVCGTTGWQSELEKVKQICLDGDHTFFYARNFSIGVNIFFHLNKELAKIMDLYTSYNPSVKEIHHIHKVDSPSGTAIQLANDIIGRMTGKSAWINGPQETNNQVSIESLREDEVPGTHLVTYHSSIDDIVITHEAHNREGFAAGAFLAAEWVIEKKGIFGMSDLLQLY